MNKTAFAVAAAFILLGLFAYFERATISSVLAIAIGLAIGLYSLFIPSERQISKKVQIGMVSGLLELGEHKIREGTVKVDYEVFKSAVEKLAPIIGRLSSMPELGFDSIYLHFYQEHDAEKALGEINALGIEASIIQNKNNWSVKIPLS